MTRLEVGRVAKAHGLRGEVVVVLTTNLTKQRTGRGSMMWAGDSEVVVSSARAHQDRFIVQFEGVNGREAADKLRGLVLSADPIEDEDAVFVHEVIGLQLIDQSGTNHGAITSVLANPASDLMELADGRLVPMAFYVRHSDGEVHVDVPQGLLSSAEEE